MQDSNHNREQDKKLARRWWQGLLLMFIVTMAFVFGTMGLFTLFGPIVRNADATSKPHAIMITSLFLVFFLFVGIGVTVFLLYLTRWSMEGQKQNFARGTLVLQRTLPHLTSEAETQAAQNIFSGKLLVKLIVLTPLYLCAMGIVVWAVRSGIQRVWPDAPKWAMDVALWAIILGSGLLIGRMVARHREKQAGEQAASPNASLPRMIGVLFFMFLVMLPVLGLLPLLGKLHTILAAPLFLVLPMLVMGILFTVYLMVPFLWVLAALKQGDYDGAIRRSQRVENFHLARGMFLNLRGFALFMAGRYEEAKQLLQESIRQVRRELMAGGADGLDNTGCALTAQGRYDEAIKMFEGAIAISPHHVSAYNDLAQAYLLQGIEPQRALELTERALKNYQASFEAKWLERFNFGAIWANRAWAFALLGRHSEAALALEQAFAVADRSFVPEFARVHYRAGQTWLLLGDRRKAAEHWSQARQLDPHGHYGGLSAQALRSLGM